MLAMKVCNGSRADFAGMAVEAEILQANPLVVSSHQKAQKVSAHEFGLASHTRFVIAI